MKYIFLFLLLACCFTTRAQLSSRSLITTTAATKSGSSSPTGDFPASKLPTFGLYGIGNTNTETFQNLNSSGKLSGYIRPFKKPIWGIPSFVDINFGFNVNASNTDSLLVSTFLFPDVGKSSFSTNVMFNMAFGEDNDFYLISPFFEFANKSVRGRKDDSTRNFYTLNSSLGVSFAYMFGNPIEQGTDKISFSVSPYLAWVNVPEPGTKNYRYLFTGDEKSALSRSIKSWGVKICFQYNSFQIFADFRTVKGSETDLPVEGLRGFHPNIGVTFNAEIFQK